MNELAWKNKLDLPSVIRVKPYMLSCRWKDENLDWRNHLRTLQKRYSSRISVYFLERSCIVVPLLRKLTEEGSFAPAVFYCELRNNDHEAANTWYARGRLFPYHSIHSVTSLGNYHSWQYPWWIHYRVPCPALLFEQRLFRLLVWWSSFVFPSLFYKFQKRKLLVMVDFATEL